MFDFSNPLSRPAPTSFGEQTPMRIGQGAINRPLASWDFPLQDASWRRWFDTLKANGVDKLGGGSLPMSGPQNISTAGPGQMALQGLQRMAPGGMAQPQRLTDQRPERLRG